MCVCFQPLEVVNLLINLWRLCVTYVSVCASMLVSIGCVHCEYTEEGDRSIRQAVRSQRLQRLGQTS